MNEVDALLILNAVEGLGNARIKKLISYYGSALKILSLKESSLKADQIIPTVYPGYLMPLLFFIVRVIFRFWIIFVSE